jgi:LPS sulfotransferase NodH
VFGTKLMWAYLDELLARFEDLGPRPWTRRPALLAELLPGARYVRVVRRDKVRQAISLWRAIRTASWRAEEDDSEHEPEFNREAIDHLLRRLFAHERAWTEHFAAAGVEPFLVEYETFTGAYAATIVDVLDWLEIERPPGFAVGDPPLRRQADHVSEDWYERYMSRSTGH